MKTKQKWELTDIIIITSVIIGIVLYVVITTLTSDNKHIQKQEYRWHNRQEAIRNYLIWNK